LFARRFYRNLAALTARRLALTIACPEWLLFFQYNNFVGKLLVFGAGSIASLQPN
jgi:hypothetical protein